MRKDLLPALYALDSGCSVTGAPVASKKDALAFPELSVCTLLRENEELPGIWRKRERALRPRLRAAAEAHGGCFFFGIAAGPCIYHHGLLDPCWLSGSCLLIGPCLGAYIGPICLCQHARQLYDMDLLHRCLRVLVSPYLRIVCAMHPCAGV